MLSPENPPCVQQETMLLLTTPKNPVRPVLHRTLGPALQQTWPSLARLHAAHCPHCPCSSLHCLCGMVGLHCLSPCPLPEQLMNRYVCVSFTRPRTRPCCLNSSASHWDWGDGLVGTYLLCRRDEFRLLALCL